MGHADAIGMRHRVRAAASVRSGPARLYAAIGAGGCLGAWARLALGSAFSPAPGAWPWGTFIANLAGCGLLGYLSTRLLERLPPSTYRRPLLGTGFCGALTTFSTMQVEVLALARDGHALMAATYAVASVLAGVVAVAAATALVRRPRLRAG